MKEKDYLLIENSNINWNLQRILSDRTLIHKTGTLYEIKALVKEIDGLKIKIYSNDHSPPHFHITANNPKINADFLIEDCSVYRDDGLNKNQLKKLKIWFNESGKALLGKKWQEFNISK